MHALNLVVACFLNIMNTEKFCLKWNDFQESIARSFKDLKEDFCDVTLTSEGNQQIEVHRVILAASSPLFRDLLRKNPHSHPLLYMRRISTKDLDSIVTFIYHGEVNIFQEDLESFLALAEELELKGLASSPYSPQKKEENKEHIKEFTKMAKPHSNSPLIQESKEPLTQETDNTFSDSFEDITYPIVSTNKPDKYSFSGTDNLSTKIDSLIEKRDGFWTCKVCGKKPSRNKKLEVSRHAEVHLEGVVHTCPLCGAVAR